MSENGVEIFTGPNAKRKCLLASVQDSRHVFQSGDTWGLANTEHKFRLALPSEITKHSKSDLQRMISEEWTEMVRQEKD